MKAAIAQMVLYFVLEIVAAVKRYVVGYCSHVQHFDRA